ALIADDAGLAQVIARVVDLINAAGGIHGDAANIGTAAVPINDHLHSIAGKANSLCKPLSLLPGSSCA
ncbi:MAG TPA: hypothetical protein VGP96_17030, partial [Candidatus Dormibacteraeota bacterium]|nr:hypothetical protein [Candidatus Dormibacteraeota bacterium]